MKNTNCITVIYCRTNQKDNLGIINQKRYLRNYAMENGFDIGGYYLDNGYSGANLNRPAFKQMIADIGDRNKKINCVIIKDLSRLSRNLSQTAEYTDNFFPEHGVRCIGVNDDYDSLDGCDLPLFTKNMLK